MKQLSFEKVNGWGGRRRGAGRKKSRVGHAKRERVDWKKPLHITLKFREFVYLRNKDGLRAFRSAANGAKRFGMGIIHYSIQRDHIHMIVEAEDSQALARGMKSFCGRMGKRIRALIGGAGAVFKDRFHMEVIRTPTQMRRTLEYVLLNTSKHMKILEHVDSFCSGFAFKEWAALLGKRFEGLIRDQIEEFARELEELTQARSWLTRTGWMRAT